MRGRFESSGHIGVHSDHDLFLLAHQCVALLDLQVDPVLELLAQDGRNHVDQPLLGDFRHVNLVGEIHEHERLVDDKLKDFLDGEVLVLRHEDRLYLVVMDVRLTSAQNIFQEVNRDVI